LGFINPLIKTCTWRTELLTFYICHCVCQVWIVVRVPRSVVRVPWVVVRVPLVVVRVPYTYDSSGCIRVVVRVTSTYDSSAESRVVVRVPRVVVRVPWEVVRVPSTYDSSDCIPGSSTGTLGLPASRDYHTRWPLCP